MVIHSRQARTLVAFLAFAALIAFGVAACDSTSARSPVSPSSAAIGGAVLDVKPGAVCTLTGGSSSCAGSTVGQRCSDPDGYGICRRLRGETFCVCR